ncbi:MAG TPA: thioredoxin domain-containing protein [Burkholderiales bacterium]|nr:thioredoxin domain-containing protein [Burkholderiales bacterium]
MESNREFLVACLCAAWCDTCTAYRPGFLAMAVRFPSAEFRGVDIEDDAEAVEDIEVENFPTILVRRGAETLFQGVLLPHHSHLERLLQKIIG